MANKRINLWDNLKFFLILCVVLGHFLVDFRNDSEIINSIYFFIYTFHMPAFVFISGLFMKNTIKNKNYNKIFSYIIIALIMKFLSFAIRHPAGLKKNLDLFDFNNVEWYAFAMFVFALVSIFLQKYNEIYVLIFSIVLALFAGFSKNIDTYLSASRIITFFPFFWAGLILDSEKILSVTKKPISKIISTIALGCTAIISLLFVDKLNWLLAIFRGKNGYSELSKFNNWGVVLRFGWYIAGFILIFSLISLTPKCKTPFSALGSRTLQVYILHMPIIIIITDVLDFENVIIELLPTAFPVVAILVAIILTLGLSSKFITKPLNTLIYPKLKADKKQ